MKYISTGVRAYISEKFIGSLHHNKEKYFDAKKKFFQNTKHIETQNTKYEY